MLTINKKKPLKEAPRSGKPWLHWVYSSIHAVLMLALLIAYQNMSISYALDGLVLGWQSDIKNTTSLKKLYSSNYKTSDFIFIDVSNDKEVVEDDDMGGNKTVITNRKELTNLFNAIREIGGYKFLMCDLVFPVKTTDDDALKAEIDQLPRAGFSLNPEGLKYAEGSVLEHLPGGKADYNYYHSDWWKSNDYAFKFRLVDDNGAATLPVYMLEAIEHQQLSRKGSFLKFDNKWLYYFNNQTVDANIRPNNLREEPNKVAVFDIDGFLVHISDNDHAVGKRKLENKIIVVADFNNDHHPTAFGTMPGALLLVNAFISLSNGDNAIGVIWLLFVLFSFTILSYQVFYPKESRLTKLVDGLTRLFEAILFNVNISILSVYTFILILIATFSYLVLSVPMGMTVLAFWLWAVSFIVDKVLGWPVYRKIAPSKRSLCKFLIQKQCK